MRDRLVELREDVAGRAREADRRKSYVEGALWRVLAAAIMAVLEARLC